MPISKKVKVFDVETGKFIIVLNEAEAMLQDFFLSDRVAVRFKDKDIAAIVDTSRTLVGPGEMAVYHELSEALGVKDGDVVEIRHLPLPASVEHIRKKLDRRTLTEDEIATIVREIVENRLSEAELASFVAGAYMHGFGIEETVALSKAMVETGDKLELGVYPQADKHCLSGNVPVPIQQDAKIKEIEIEKIVDEKFSSKKEGFVKNKENVKALTFDENGVVRFWPIDGFFRVKTPTEIFSIELSDGRKIKLTSDHTVFVFNKTINAICRVMARDLRKGDLVLVPSFSTDVAPLFGNLSALKIKSVRKERCCDEYLYDLRIPNFHRFFAGSAPMCVHNCIGGVAGNRTTMVIVPILAAAGVYIAKTSSRAISMASGTADTMEVLAPVVHPIDELRKIVLKTKGCIVWGGAINLAPVDDKLIRVRNTMHLDPRGLLLASIMGKKKAAGAQYLIVDIPIGRGAKIENESDGKSLANDFIQIGDRLGIKTRCLITDGSDPVGYGVGPALECIDVLNVLEGRPPTELLDKSCLLAGHILEMVGRAEAGMGAEVALKLIQTGKAMEKMREIIAAQGGNPNVKIEDLPVGQNRYVWKADRAGRIAHVDNRAIAKIARAAGAPKDKGAGVILHCETGDKVSVGDALFEIVSESETKLSFAIETAEKLRPVELQKVIIGKIE